MGGGWEVWSGSDICMCVPFSTYMWLSKLSTFFDGDGGWGRGWGVAVIYVCVCHSVHTCG